MIYIKKRAENDLTRLFLGLIRHANLSMLDSLEYIREIKAVCFSLEETNVRRKTINYDHKKFGKYYHRFDKHDDIQWYIIYDFDKYNNIAIKKIISNKTTKKAYPRKR